MRHQQVIRVRYGDDLADVELIELKNGNFYLEDGQNASSKFLYNDPVELLYKYLKNMQTSFFERKITIYSASSEILENQTLINLQERLRNESGN